MGRWSELMIESSAPRWCYSTQDYNERQNDRLIAIEEKIIPEWFYLPYCDDCKDYREFTNNVCPYQSTHKVSLPCAICEKVYITYYYSYEYNPTCSQECYVKYKTISCFDCQNMFFQNSFKRRCSSCYDLIRDRLEKLNHEELRKLAKKYKISRRKKEYIISELIGLNHPIPLI